MIGGILWGSGVERFFSQKFFSFLHICQCWFGYMNLFAETTTARPTFSTALEALPPSLRSQLQSRAG